MLLDVSLCVLWMTFVCDSHCHHTASIGGQRWGCGRLLGPWGPGFRGVRTVGTGGGGGQDVDGSRGLGESDTNGVGNDDDCDDGTGGQEYAHRSGRKCDNDYDEVDDFKIDNR